MRPHRQTSGQKQQEIEDKEECVVEEHVSFILIFV